MDFIETIYNSGVVGCGGAGFPTHKKLDTKVKNLVINAAECEPLLRTDHYLMRYKAKEIIQAVEMAGKTIGAKNMWIGLKHHYEKEIEALNKAIKSRKSKVKLFYMDNFYPAGDEQVLAHEVTGGVVPPAGIPSEIDSVVSNLSTMYQCWEASKGKPFTHKYLTVTGEVENPVILRVPIGTPIRECIEAAGCRLSEFDFILGGPCMGGMHSSFDLDSQFVTKTTSGIIVLEKGSYLKQQTEIPLRSILNRAKSACIQCERCTEMCPRHLLGHPLRPHMIMRKLAYESDVENLLDDKDIRQANICSSCGICELYACPMHLNPRKVNQAMKSLLMKEGIRYERTEDSWEVSPHREYRKIPSKRLANKIGVGKYYDYDIDTLKEFEPDRVRVSLRQHIGMPAQPVISTGDQVECGQLIASVDFDKMGTNIHASIDGTATVEDGYIIIERNNK